MKQKIDGFIEMFSPIRGFGIILDQIGQKYFFHYTNILVGIPQTGANVRFHVGQNSKGRTALDVEIVEGGAL